MADITQVSNAAKRLASQDEETLVMLIGMIDAEIKKNPTIADDPNYQPKYDSNTMGLVDDLKRVGRKILNRWNKELHGLVCGNKPDNQMERDAILNALDLVTYQPSLYRI